MENFNMNNENDEKEINEVSDDELLEKQNGNIKLNIKNKLRDDEEDDDDDEEDAEEDGEDDEEDDDDDDDEDNVYITDEEDETETKKKPQNASASSSSSNNRIENDENENEDDEDDDEEDEDENYLKKFDKDIKKNYLESYHPEAYSHNFEEVKMLSNVVRDENNNIIDPLHKTIPFLTKFEKSRILGQRAKQIDSGSTPFVKVDKTIIDGYLIALKELEEKKIPFIIKRPLPNGGFEYWNVSDLELVC